MLSKSLSVWLDKLWELDLKDVIGTPDLLDQQFGSSYNPDTVSKQPRSRYLQRAGNNLQSAGNTYSRF